jgi:hypothetical protein
MNTLQALKFIPKLFVFAMLFVLVSCSEDDKPVRKLVIDGENIPLANGYLIYNGGFNVNEDAGSSYDIILSTKNLTADEFGDAVGTGDFIKFDLLSEDTESLLDGTYTFSGGNFLGEMVECTARVGYDASLETEGNGVGFYAVEGAVTIVKSGNSYKITFDLTMVQEGTESEVQVTGKYEGKLVYIDDAEVV